MKNNTNNELDVYYTIRLLTITWLLFLTIIPAIMLLLDGTIDVSVAKDVESACLSMCMILMALECILKLIISE